MPLVNLKISLFGHKNVRSYFINTILFTHKPNNFHLAFNEYKSNKPIKNPINNALEQIVILLSRPDILQKNSGNKGGYMFSKESCEYKVGQILRITEGSLSPVSCLDDEPNRCQRSDFYKTLFVWEGLQNVVNDYLDRITLQMILDK